MDIPECMKARICAEGKIAREIREVWKQSVSGVYILLIVKIRRIGSDALGDHVAFFTEKQAA